MSLKQAIAAILASPLQNFGASLPVPLSIPIVLGYAQSVVERPCVSLLRIKGTPKFYVGEEGGPYDYVGGTSLTPKSLTEVLWEEQVVVHIETVDSLTLLDNIYTLVIQTFIGELSNLAAAGWANASMEAGEETMIPVNEPEGKRARFYYGQPIIVTAVTQAHSNDPLILPEPLPAITEIDLSTGVVQPGIVVAAGSTVQIVQATPPYITIDTEVTEE